MSKRKWVNLTFPIVWRVLTSGWLWRANVAILGRGLPIGWLDLDGQLREPTRLAGRSVVMSVDSVQLNGQWLSRLDQVGPGVSSRSCHLSPISRSAGHTEKWIVFANLSSVIYLILVELEATSSNLTEHPTFWPKSTPHPSATHLASVTAATGRGWVIPIVFPSRQNPASNRHSGNSTFTEQLPNINGMHTKLLSLIRNYKDKLENLTSSFSTSSFANNDQCIVALHLLYQPRLSWKRNPPCSHNNKRLGIPKSR